MYSGPFYHAECFVFRFIWRIGDGFCVMQSNRGILSLLGKRGVLRVFGFTPNDGFDSFRPTLFSWGELSNRALFTLDFGN